MASKFIALACLVVSSSAGIVAQEAYNAAPLAYASPVAKLAVPGPEVYTAHVAPFAYSSPVAKVAIPAPVAYSAHVAPLAYAAPVAKLEVAAPSAKVAIEEYDPHPQYSLAYDVQDGLTGDSKSQHESRDGDVVQGSYSVLDPDSTKRTVDYTADPYNGFNAVVHREPLAHVAKVAVAPVQAYHAAPVVAKVAAPIAYSAPAYYHH